MSVQPCPSDLESRWIPAGEVLFRQGDVGAVMYVVQAGRLAVAVDGVTVETVAAGGIVGELGLLDEGPRSATVIALTDCRLMQVDRRCFDRVLRRAPGFAMQVMRILGGRLRRTEALP